jgi:hypothetical protein
LNANKLLALKETAAEIWTSAQDANLAAHATRRQELQAQLVDSVEVRVENRVRTCFNTQHDHTFNLGEMYPQYFGPTTMATLHSVHARFQGSGGGEEGMFKLRPGVGEYLVSTGGIGGKRYNGYRLFYNSHSTVMKVHLESAGWRCGVCSTRCR